MTITLILTLIALLFFVAVGVLIFIQNALENISHALFNLWLLARHRYEQERGE